MYTHKNVRIIPASSCEIDNQTVTVICCCEHMFDYPASTKIFMNCSTKSVNKNAQVSSGNWMHIATFRTV